MIANDPRVFYENMMIIDHFTSHVQGAIVECGTWRGGMACAMMALGGADRSYHFFDSFEGLPEVTDPGIDGESALQYQVETDSPFYYNNCSADYDEFIDLIHKQKVPVNQISVYKGWFNNTVKTYTGGAISVLRLDGDWYESTMTCLEALYPLVSFGGAVIIDDYEAWDGCTRAVHDYLSRISSRSRIDRTPLSHVAFIQKLD